MPIMEVSVIPVGGGTASLGDTVVETLKPLKQQGLKFELNAMGTNLEGDLDTLFRAVRQMHEAGFKKGAPRVLTVIKLDDRRDKELSMEYKVKSVLEKLGP